MLAGIQYGKFVNEYMFSSVTLYYVGYFAMNISGVFIEVFRKEVLTNFLSSLMLMTYLF